MERLIHIYGLLAITMILMVAASVAYLYYMRSKERQEQEAQRELEPITGPKPQPKPTPEIVREETKDAIIFRDKDGYLINIIKK